MRLRSILAVTLVAGAGALVACREPKTPEQNIALLQSTDPEARQHAADDLRTDQGVPPQAVPELLRLLPTEPVPKVRGAMLITLGRSGVPEAKPLIDQHLNTPDRDMRRWAARAYKYWLIATRQVPENHEFPPEFPYGQPGFPPPLPPEN